MQKDLACRCGIGCADSIGFLRALCVELTLVPSAKLAFSTAVGLIAYSPKVATTKQMSSFCGTPPAK